MKIQKTRHHSYKIGNVPKGCKLCVQGKKLVLFLTGLCPRRCYFCPISDKKYKKDVIYADEWPVTHIDEVIKEAHLISAKGAGFTGGDPLCKLWRTLFSLRELKQEFGENFHVHLYTSLNLVSEDNLGKLYKAGLDEIRFHLDLDNDKLWNRVKYAKKYVWKVGVEIPVIPKKEDKIKDLIRFLREIRIDFLNLNELEIADNKHSKLSKKGYKTKNKLSYGVKGSEESALRILKYCKGKLKNVHYCTATLKDKVQLANRIKRRAKNVKKQYDKITSEGTLIHGAIYLPELKPSFGYQAVLEGTSKKKKSEIIRKLHTIKNQLKRTFKVKDNLIEVDEKKLRILTSIKEIRKIRANLNKKLLKNMDKSEKGLRKKELFLAIVREYPTYDQLELDVEFL